MYSTGLTEGQFASHSGGNSLGAEDMKKKLQLVVELAKDIWGEA